MRSIMPSRIDRLWTTTGGVPPNAADRTVRCQIRGTPVSGGDALDNESF